MLENKDEHNPYKERLLKEKERFEELLKYINLGVEALEGIYNNDSEDRYASTLKLLMFGLRDIKEQVEYEMSENDISLENLEEIENDDN